MKLNLNVFIIFFMFSLLAGCAADTTGEKFFRRSSDGENRIPFDGRSECLPFENYSPPDDCPDE